MDNTTFYIIIFLVAAILIFFITLFLKRRDDIDSEISIFGMKFKITTKNNKKSTLIDPQKTGVVINGVKLKGSKIGKIAGRDVRNNIVQRVADSTEASQVEIKDTEITDSEIDNISGRDINRNK